MRFLVALLLSIGALAASPHIVSGGSARATRQPQPIETRAPNPSHDDTWEAATRVATTTDSASQFRTLHARAIAAISHRAPLLPLGRRLHERVDAADDRSPRHPIPLLI